MLAVNVFTEFKLFKIVFSFLCSLGVRVHSRRKGEEGRIEGGSEEGREDQKGGSGGGRKGEGKL